MCDYEKRSSSFPQTYVGRSLRSLQPLFVTTVTDGTLLAHVRARSGDLTDFVISLPRLNLPLRSTPGRRQSRRTRRTAPRPASPGRFRFLRTLGIALLRSSRGCSSGGSPPFQNSVQAVSENGVGLVWERQARHRSSQMAVDLITAIPFHVARVSHCGVAGEAARRSIDRILWAFTPPLLSTPGSWKPPGSV